MCIGSPGEGSRARPWLLFAAGEGVFLGIAVLPDARRHLAAYVLLFLAGSLLSLVAARSLSASDGRFLIFCAAAFRLTLLFRPPDLSEDVLRYLWDGRVAASGRSPYGLAPADPRAAGISSGLQNRLARPELRTVYPPVAEAAFRVVASVPGGGIVAMKTLFSLADVAVVVLLLASGGAGARFGAALYAFHPLPVTETAGQGHLDALGVALLLASVVYVSRRRPLAAGIAFAAAVLVKYVPLAASAPLARRGKLWFAAAAIAVGAAVWGLAAQAGVSPAVGLGPLATRWEFNSLLYPAVSATVETAEIPQKAKAAYIRWKEEREHRLWMQDVFPYFYSAFFARALLGIFLIAALVTIAVTVKDLELALFASIATLLLVSPTLHPWYLLWVLPFAAKRREPAFVYLCTAAPLAYGLLYPLRGWTPLAIRVAEYGPFAALLGWTLLRSQRPHPAPLPGGESH
ncbi:MAG TPA: glycosyltransferase 87 family protein [Thermoanaerobaculia bacterium]|nr:glycosyltransferase 87 family protein [Thermoanaerobaculia bacterium]